jgi:hypothetical protein
VGDVAAPDPTVGVGPQVPLELHQAPDLGAVNSNVGLDVGGRLADGVEVDAEQLGALLQRGGDGAGQGGSRASEAGMPGSLEEHVFEEQRDESGEQPVHDIDIRRS